jgi:hypothetical protein
LTQLQSEQALEGALIKQPGTLGYSDVSVPDEAALKANLKTRLEKHNETTFSDSEFQKILHWMSCHWQRSRQIDRVNPGTMNKLILNILLAA